MMVESKPFKDSLWMNCLFELYDKAQKEGDAIVKFEDVDKLVIEKSKIISKYEVDDEPKG